MNYLGMRDCVREVLEKGTTCNAWNGRKMVPAESFLKWRYAIIFELNRLGFKRHKILRTLLEWNNKNTNPFSASESRHGFESYIKWFFKHTEGKYSCKALAAYCLGSEKCHYYSSNTKREEEEYEADCPHDPELLRAFLQKEDPKHAQVLDWIICVLRRRRDEIKKTEIFMGFQDWADRVNLQFGCRLDRMTISRHVHTLSELNILKRTSTGKFRAPGRSAAANGYKLLPWTPP